MKNNAVKINEKDNVAIAMHDVAKNEAVVVDGRHLFKAVEDIEAGHKIALSAIASGEKVYRYGEPIIEATRAISQGEWVHVHNTLPIPGDVKV